MREKVRITNGKVFLGNLEFDAATGMLNLPKGRLQEREIFSGVRNGRVFVKNRLTSIDAEKFQALPRSVRERILEFPNSDYARDVLAQPKGMVVKDTFPNFNQISYSSKGEAIILNDDFGEPIRALFFPD